MPRYVQVPPDVRFVSKVTGKPDLELNQETHQLEQKELSFRKFVLGVLIHHPIFCTVVGGRALYKFEQALDEALAGDGVMLIDEDVWETFRKALEKPIYQAAGPAGVQTIDGFPGYSGSGVMQMLPLVDAILDAPSKKAALIKPVAESAVT